MDESSPEYVQAPPPDSVLAKAIGIGILVMWLLLVPAGCIASIELCDLGAQLRSESDYGDPDADTKYDSCLAAAHDRRMTVAWAAGGAVVVSIAGAAVASRLHGAPGRYRDPLVAPGLPAGTRYWDGEHWWAEEHDAPPWRDHTTH